MPRRRGGGQARVRRTTATEKNGAMTMFRSTRRPRLPGGRRRAPGGRARPPVVDRVADDLDRDDDRSTIQKWRRTSRKLRGSRPRPSASRLDHRAGRARKTKARTGPRNRATGRPRRGAQKQVDHDQFEKRDITGGLARLGGSFLLGVGQRDRDNAAEEDLAEEAAGGHRRRPDDQGAELDSSDMSAPAGSTWCEQHISEAQRDEETMAAAAAARTPRPGGACSRSWRGPPAVAAGLVIFRAAFVAWRTESRPRRWTSTGSTSPTGTTATSGKVIRICSAQTRCQWCR